VSPRRGLAQFVALPGVSFTKNNTNYAFGALLAWGTGHIHTVIRNPENDYGAGLLKK